MMETILVAALAVHLLHAGDVGYTADFLIEYDSQPGVWEPVPSSFQSEADDVWLYKVYTDEARSNCVQLKAQLWNVHLPSPWSNEIIRCPEPDGLGAGLLALAGLARRRRSRGC